jgi:D-alanine-D-alanine ligase
MTRRNYGKVAVLMGGPSAEREVSLKSGNAVLAALKRQSVNAHGIDADKSTLRELEDGKFDRAFIALHGRWGEDGVIQGALEVLGIPYTGSGLLGSALGMDKLRSKYLWSAAGIPTPEYAPLEAGVDLNQVAAKLGLPVFVKPVREGSSLGISKAKTAAELKTAWETAAKYDDQVIAERFIEGAELTCGILGDQALPLIRIETDREFYDYEAKYILDTTR